MIDGLPMLVDLQVDFVMFTFCYAQWLNYLQHNVFPSLGILQHYIEFNVRTIAMLEKLLVLRSFGTIVGHFVHH
jgi:hypothetical protein